MRKLLLLSVGLGVALVGCATDSRERKAGSPIDDDAMAIKHLRVLRCPAFGEDERSARELTRKGRTSEEKGQQDWKQRHESTDRWYEVVRRGANPSS